MSGIYEINLAKTEFREGFNAGDVDRVLSVFSESFTDFSDGLPSFFGAEAAQAMRLRLERLFRDYQVELAVAIIDVEITGDSALDYGWHEFTLTPGRGGEAMTVRERYIERWSREPKGKWRIAIYITNRDHAPDFVDAAISRAQAASLV